MIFRYQVFILNAQPLLHHKELAVLKFFRKKIIVVFLGTDSRPCYLAGNLIHTKYNIQDGINLCHQETLNKKQIIRYIEKYADIIINHPPTALFHEKPFISWLNIGFPFDPDDIPVTLKETRDKIKIAHAPSSFTGKGSAAIIEMINKLIQDGLPVSFSLLENLPNNKLIEELQKCDLIVNEVYSDVPLSSLGTEAAFSRKVIITSGYYAGSIHNDYPEKVIPPGVFCSPEEIEGKIREMVTDGNKRDRTAENQYNFVMQNWKSTDIAQKYLDILSGPIPEDWFYDPSKLSYFLGYGIEKKQLKTFIANYIARFGIEALCLSDKPELQDKLLSFINGNGETR